MTVRGTHPETGRDIEIQTRDGRIEAVNPTAGASAGSPFVSPGWIDLQVNGFAGVDYNDPLSPHDEIARSIDMQRSTGVARFYPTVITGSFEDMTGALRNLARCRESVSNGRAMLGFHVEGPWISPHDGPRGAHPRQHVRPPSIDEYKAFQDAADGNVRLVTVSPEHGEAPPVIEHMASEGIVVAIGHTCATASQIQDAVLAGASMSTHLGNGAHSMIARHDNYIVHQMADDRLYAGLIVDGIHLPAPWVKVALRAKGLGRSILVTDAVMPACCEPGLYKLGEQDVELTADQCVRLASSGRLAGSALSMDRGMTNAMRFAGLALPEATRLATTNAGEAMGLDDRQRYLEPGMAADFTLFSVDADGRIVIERTIVRPD